MKTIPLQLRGFFLCAWLCVGALAVWNAFTTHDEWTATLVCSSLIMACLLFSRYVLGLSFASTPLLYLLVLGVFHVGLVLPWALGIYDLDRMPWFSLRGLVPALALVTLATATYQLGLVLALHTPRLRREVVLVSGEWIEDSSLFYAGLALYVFGVAMFVVGLFGLDKGGFASLTYTETYRLRAESDPRFFGTGMTIAAIALSVASAGVPRKGIKIIYLCTALWLACLFYIGFRGPALVAGLTVLAVLVKKGAKYPRWVLLLALLIMSFSIAIIRVVREEPLATRFEHVTLSDINLLDGLAEMGGSIRPLIETYERLRPGEFRKGMTYVTAFTTIVPNLSQKWTPLQIQSDEQLPPSHWITLQVDPWAYRNYGGLGFSAVAEPYMNFGYAGVAIYFLLLGFFLIWMETNALGSPYFLAGWALIVGPLLWTARNDFHNFVRPVVWGLAYLWLTKWGLLILNTYRNRGSKPRPLHLQQRRSSQIQAD